jgi:hypothetical protein
MPRDARLPEFATTRKLLARVSSPARSMLRSHFQNEWVPFVPARYEWPLPCKSFRMSCRDAGISRVRA